MHRSGRPPPKCSTLTSRKNRKSCRAMMYVPDTASTWGTHLCAYLPIATSCSRTTIYQCVLLFFVKPSLLSNLACWFRAGVCWENMRTGIQTHSRLGTAERMSSIRGFCLTRGVTFHPGPMSQAERALSVTDALDSCDKDGNDIWTPKGRGGRKTMNMRTAKKLGGHGFYYISEISFKNNIL